MKDHPWLPSQRGNSLCCLVVVALLVGLLLAGCNRKSDPTGTFNLVTIDGNQLPFNPTGVGRGPEIQSGAIAFQRDGSFKSTLRYRLPDGKVNTRESSGNYTKEGSSFKLQWKGAGVTTGTIEGNSFSIEDDGMKCVYRK